MFTVCSTPWFVIVLILVQTVDFVAGRQMCYSCSFVSNPNNHSRNCILKPREVWQNQWAVPCPYKCIMVSDYDFVSKSTRALTRACGHDQGKNRCIKRDRYELCYYTCESELCNGFTMGQLNETNRPPGNAVVLHQTAVNVIVKTLFAILTIFICDVKS